MSYKSKIKICGIKSAAEARTVLACSSALCANLECANDAKNLPQSGDENPGRNFNSDAENSTRNSGSKNFAQNFNQGSENSACRAQNHPNFTCEQNCDCDKNFGGSSRNPGDSSGVRVEFLGVIFVSSSKRRVSIDTAREIAHIAHENGAKCVGVFALSSEKHDTTPQECENFGDKARGEEICEDKIYAGTSGGVEFCGTAEFHEKQREDLNVNLNANCAVSASVKDLNSEILYKEALDEEQILKICSLCELDCAQIYGSISVDFKARLNAAGIEAWQVLRIGAEMPPLEGLSFDRILFDAKGASLGGNGVSFDWDLLRRAGLGYQGRDGATSDKKNCAGATIRSSDDAKSDEDCGANAYATSRSIGTKPAREGADDCGANDYEAGVPNIANDSEASEPGFAKDDSMDGRGTDPQNSAISFVLAGGIGAQNILEALALRPYAIDLNSRVEDARGIKEPQKISEILRLTERADSAAD